jgi:hypothetical protein
VRSALPAGEGVGEQPGTLQPPTMFPEHGSGLDLIISLTRPALSAGHFFSALMPVRAAPALRFHAIVAEGTERQGIVLEWHQSCLNPALGEVALEILCGLSWLRTVERSPGAICRQNDPRHSDPPSLAPPGLNWARTSAPHGSPAIAGRLFFATGERIIKLSKHRSLSQK